MRSLVVRARGITKYFRLYSSPADRLKEILLGRRRHRLHVALKDVTFSLHEGEILGIIGRNGSGKSTLLKILMKILLPDGGEMEIKGRVTGLLELGTGFNYEFSGRDNIFFNAAFLGISKDAVRSKMDEIIAFAELDDFIDEPLKTYSSGMVMRLAFSIAIHADPKIFLVDEALAVGDVYFQQKCIRKIREFKENGGAIIFVSHDLAAVKFICDRAILLEQGQVLEEGKPEDVVNTYNFIIARLKEGYKIQKPNSNDNGFSHGNEKVKITSVEMKNPAGEKVTAIKSGDSVIIVVTVLAESNVDDLTVGILIRDRFGQDIFGTSTYFTHGKLQIKERERLSINWKIKHLNIGPGQYTLTVAAHRGMVHIEECYHWIDKALHFEVLPPDDLFFVGLARLPVEVKIHQG